MFGVIAHCGPTDVSMLFVGFFFTLLIAISVIAPVDTVGRGTLDAWTCFGLFKL